MASKSVGRGSKKGGTKTRTSKRGRAVRRRQMPFGKRNYLLMAVGMLIIVVGYAVMRIENEVDGFISLFVAPVLLLIGYVEIAYAIWWRPKENAESSTGSQ